jgi:tRNA(fMet)-specific endonuclease VapC
MAAVVVDTCVVSFGLKRDSRAELYRPHLHGYQLVISFMTLAELYRWPLERDWGETRRMDLEHRLREYTVYPFTRDLCRTWAAVTDQARRNGNEIEVDDAWVAATALLYGIPLVTHNRSDFEGVPHLQIISESP